MIFKILEQLLYDYKISAEQWILLELIQDDPTKFQAYISMFPEEKGRLLQNLLRRGFISETENPTVFKLTAYSEDALEKLNAPQEIKSTDVDITKWVEEFRSLFDGLKLGSMGSKSACLKKMKLFHQKNPDVTLGEILEATKAYIESLRGDYRYLQQADYFIQKHDGSRLETWIEEVKKGNTSKGDWTTQLV